MKQARLFFITGLLGAFFMTAGFLQAQGSAVTGDWVVSINSTSPATWVANLKQDGANLTGQIHLGETRTAETYEVKGTVQDKKVTFNFVIITQDGNEPVTMTAELDGDSMKGEKTNFWEAGEGPWTAKKK